MSTPTAKRRRLNNSSKLTQPFKSPFITPLKPSTEASSPYCPQKISNSSTDLSSMSVQPATTTPYPSSYSPSDLSTSTDLPILRSTHSSLLRQLATIRTTLDQHEQALRIESSTRDANLHRLVGVWKTASRSAAEEVYAKARDRVNRMGGVGAMKEREKGGGWGRGWEDEDKGRSNGRGDEDEESTTRVEEEEEDGGNKENEEVVADDEPYTMAMMLKTLNIELPLIGYDAEMQRWVD